MGKYRLLVSGSARLSKQLVPFTKALGSSLMDRGQIVLVTGGLAQRDDGIPTVDRTVVEGALERLGQLGSDPRERIVTLLPEKDWDQISRFQHGETETIPHTDLRSRRYYMVHSSDSVLTIEGHKATQDIIDLAWITRKPLLPLPFTGGLSQKKWGEYREELADQFSLTPGEISELESPLGDADQAAELCAKIIERRLKPTCFLAMKFNDSFTDEVYTAIAETLDAKGYATLRLDKVPITGSIIASMWDSIRRADLLVVDITRSSPNVFYELGIAHALNKEVIITSGSKDGRVPDDVPFDIRVHQILPYREDDLNSLKEQLRKRIEMRWEPSRNNTVRQNHPNAGR